MPSLVVARTPWKRIAAQSCCTFQIRTGENTSDRDQHREIRIGAAQPAPAPIRHQQKGGNRRREHDHGEFRQHRQPGEQAGREPPAAVAALRKPHQAPHHRHRKRDHGDIGRDLGHQQAVIERGFRHQHREHDGAHVMGEAADDVGEQELVTSIATMPPKRTPSVVSPKIAVPNRISQAMPGG